MNQTITVSEKTIDSILSRLDKLSTDVRAIKIKLFEEKSSYGSAAWWEKEDRRALKSIREGKGTVIRSKKELSQFFKNL